MEEKLDLGKLKAGNLDLLTVNCLKTELHTYGFDKNFVLDIIEKYGIQSLIIACQAARNGFSVSLVMNIITLFGPAFLQMLVDWYNKKQEGKVEEEPNNKDPNVDQTLRALQKALCK